MWAVHGRDDRTALPNRLALRQRQCDDDDLGNRLNLDRELENLPMTSLKRLLYFFLILTTSVLFWFPKAAHGQSPDTKPKGTASISGKVTIGGKAAFGIAVAAFGGDSYSRRAAAQTTTDSEGRYRLFGLAAATYQVTVFAPALVNAEPSNNYPYGGKMILLSAAEAVEDVDLKLVRGAVITGRITDEEAKPVVEERMNLESVVEQAGRPPIQMSPAYMNGQMYQTDDRGVYRIYGLPAGRYKVSVGSQEGGFSAALAVTLLRLSMGTLMSPRRPPLSN